MQQAWYGAYDLTYPLTDVKPTDLPTQPTPSTNQQQ